MGDVEQNQNSPSSSVGDSPTQIIVNPLFKTIRIVGPLTLTQLIVEIQLRTGFPVDSLSSGGHPYLTIFHYMRPRRPYLDFDVVSGVHQCELESMMVVEGSKCIPVKASKEGAKIRMTGICEKCEDMSLIESEIEINQSPICHHIQTKTTENQQLCPSVDKVIGSKAAKILRTKNRTRKIGRLVLACRANRVGKGICFTAFLGGGLFESVGVLWSLEEPVDEV